MRDKLWNIVGVPTHELAEGVEMLPSALRSDELSDESFESKLPDDYQVLAEQLIADADHLAANYPPSTPASSNSVVSNPRRLPWKSLTAAVILVAVGAGLGASVAKFYSANQPASLAKQSAGEARADHMAIDLKPTSRAAVAAANPAGIAEVGLSPTTAPRPVLDEVKLLHTQIDAFEQVIRKLQAELARKEQAQANTEAMIESLRREISILRRQLDEPSPAAK